MNQQQDIREIIKQEYIKCVKDPIHFIKKYCQISHPQRGKIPFNLYPFQEQVLRCFKDKQNNIVLKSRQLGLSTLAAGYALWLMLFNDGKNILCIATTQNTAKNMVTKVSFMYHNLPSWLKEKDKDGKYLKPLEDSKLTLKLNNDSKIQATSSASDSARSISASLLIVDEAAFIDGIEDIWASAQQTLSTGGRAIILSTPNGTGNWFHRMWMKAEEQKNNYTAIKLHWSLHPERNQKWRDQQDAELGDPRIAAQECDCNFLTSGNTYFPLELVDWYEKEKVCDPIEKRGEDQALWIFERVDFTKNYMVVADPSRGGDGSDFSAFHVIEIETNTQVAEFQSQIETRPFANLLVAIATEYNNALLVVENNNMGWDVVQSILQIGYKNLYWSLKSGEGDISSYTVGYEDPNKMTPGFNMGKGTRPSATAKFKEYVCDKSANIRSRRLTGEMKVFVYKNGKPEAQYGYNDDLIMAFSMGQFLRETSLKFRQNNLDLTRATLNNITSYSPYSGNNNINGIQNPYQMNIGRGQTENIKWLF